MKECDYNRDCSKVPIPDRCVKYCLEKIARNATIEENQLILGLDEDLAIDIFNSYKDTPINSFSDLKDKLTSQQTNSLVEKFKNINQFQLNYFNRSHEERESVINAIKELTQDSDTDLLFTSKL